MRVLVLVYQGMRPPKGATVSMAQWQDWKTEFHVIRALKRLGHTVKVVELDHSLAPLEISVTQFQPHIVFNLLEEFAGNPFFDKHIVAHLELLDIPYTGSGPDGLFLSRDKSLAKKVLSFHGIKTPAFLVCPLGQKKTQFLKAFQNFREDLVETSSFFPLIVKSLTEDASLGISQASVVHSKEALWERVQFIQKRLGTDVLIEEYIVGRELYLGGFGTTAKNVRWLPLWELNFGDLAKTNKAVATRNLKFNKKFNERHGVHRGVAKDLSPGLQGQIHRAAEKAWAHLGLSGYARMDFRLSKAGVPYLIEVNPNPELAKGEDFANAASQAGLSYPDLIQSLLELGLRRRPKGWALAA